MVSTMVCKSEGSELKSRSGQIAYLHGVKTRLSTLGTGDSGVARILVWGGQCIHCFI